MPYDDRTRWGDSMDGYKIFIAKAFLFLMTVCAVAVTAGVVAFVVWAIGRAFGSW